MCVCTYRYIFVCTYKVLYRQREIAVCNLFLALAKLELWTHLDVPVSSLCLHPSHSHCPFRLVI